MLTPGPYEVRSARPAHAVEPLASALTGADLFSRVSSEGPQRAPDSGRTSLLSVSLAHETSISPCAPAAPEPAYVPSPMPALLEANDPRTFDEDACRARFDVNPRFFRPLHHRNELTSVYAPIPTRDPKIQCFLSAWASARYYHRTTKVGFQGILAARALEHRAAGTGLSERSWTLSETCRHRIFFGWRPELYLGEVIIPLFMYRDARALVKPDPETYVGRICGYSHFIENEDIPLAGSTPSARPAGYAVVLARKPPYALDNPRALEGRALEQVLDVVRSHYERGAPSHRALRSLYRRAIQQGFFARDPEPSLDAFAVKKPGLPPRPETIR